MKIETLEDLRKERARIKLQLKEKQIDLSKGILQLQQDIKPLSVASKFIGKFLVHKNTGLVNEGVGLGIDVLLRNVLLSRAGWITKLIVPFLAKNVSNNIISNNKPEILDYLRDKISHIRTRKFHKNGKFDESTAYHEEFD